MQNLESRYVEFSENYELSKVELARLAEAMGGESQLTKAIDLARGGASAEEITLGTGLGEDEASAIVKFHRVIKTLIQNHSYHNYGYPELHLHWKDRFRTGKHRISIAAFDPHCASVSFDLDVGIFHFCGDRRFVG